MGRPLASGTAPCPVASALQPGMGPASQVGSANPFSQRRPKPQSCDRLRYIAGSAAAGLAPANASRLS